MQQKSCRPVNFRNIACQKKHLALKVFFLFFSFDFVEIAHLQQFFTFFTMLTLIFLKNNKCLEHLNVLLRIFFVSGIFQSLEVDFWPLLKEEKSASPKPILAVTFFLFKILLFIIHIKDINLQSAGFLSFKEKSGPLLQPQ